MIAIDRRGGGELRSPSRPRESEGPSECAVVDRGARPDPSYFAQGRSGRVAGERTKRGRQWGVGELREWALRRTT